MSQAFTGEIRMLPYTFAPMGWAWCNGQQLSVQTNAALYAVIGYAFGGSGPTFNLPNLQGLTPMHSGTGVGLTPRVFASSGGTTTETLGVNQMPNHSHTVNGDNVAGNQGVPSSTVYPSRDQMNARYKTTPDPTKLVAMGVGALAVAGGGQSHGNLQPYQVVNHCICLEGVFPARN